MTPVFMPCRGQDKRDRQSKQYNESVKKILPEGFLLQLLKFGEFK